MITIDLQGLNELINEFDRIGKDISKYENRAIKSASKVLQGEIAKRAPKSDAPKLPGNKDKWRTGQHMADNIYVSGIRTKNGMKYVKVGPSIKDNSPYFYGKFHEWGTTKMKATPFIQPAVEAKESEMIQAMKEELQKGLKI